MMHQQELNKRVNEVFDLDENDFCCDVHLDNEQLCVTLVDPDGVPWDYLPDMSNRPEALDYLLGKRNDFND